MTVFVVEVYGFDPEQFQAETKAKATWQAYRTFRESGRNWDFHRFLINLRIWKA
ncbi:hypothetical protein J2Y48_003102 [Mycoplana sp. BE70]|uniref:hypothetical protein n=1 Tax=Mycoplana sp. BE70 TaxID=2817775 RepID=UPI002856412B|nr:hypothetical protein [Mycoplana sp. BE70]MDR6757805.1 hypothetical protein [Mycoplana sp. BE70]